MQNFSMFYKMYFGRDLAFRFFGQKDSKIALRVQIALRVRACLR